MPAINDIEIALAVTACGKDIQAYLNRSLQQGCISAGLRPVCAAIAVYVSPSASSAIVTPAEVEPVRAPSTFVATANETNGPPLDH